MRISDWSSDVCSSDLIRLQGSAERKVGQLAFSQFLASVALADDIVTAGAQALERERSWTYALDYEQRFGERGLLTAGVERERTENSIDATVLDDGLKEIGRAHVGTPVTNAYLVCRLLLENNNHIMYEVVSRIKK